MDDVKPEYIYIGPYMGEFINGKLVSKTLIEPEQLPELEQKQEPGKNIFETSNQVTISRDKPGEKRVLENTQASKNYYTLDNVFNKYQGPFISGNILDNFYSTEFQKAMLLYDSGAING